LPTYLGFAIPNRQPLPGLAGILKDKQKLKNDFNALAERSLQSLSATGLIRRTPELVVLDPTLWFGFALVALTADMPKQKNQSSTNDFSLVSA
jgi:hypothetical protein